MPFQLSTAGDLVPVIGSVAALNGDLVAACDTSNFNVALFQLYGTFNGTVTFQGSVEDVPTNWIGLTAINITNGNVASTANVAGMYYVPLTCKWFRARVTTYASGTLQSTAIFSIEEMPLIEAGNQIVSGTVTLGNSAGNNGANLAARLSGASGVIKASAGRMGGYILQNTNAASRYLQLYNKATAGVPGTDTPVITIPMNANGITNFSDPIGYYGATGLAWAITTDAAGATAGGSGDIVGTIFYA